MKLFAVLLTFIVLIFQAGHNSVNGDSDQVVAASEDVNGDSDQVVVVVPSENVSNCGSTAGQNTIQEGDENVLANPNLVNRDSGQVSVPSKSESGVTTGGNTNVENVDVGKNDAKSQNPNDGKILIQSCWASATKVGSNSIQTGYHGDTTTKAPRKTTRATRSSYRNPTQTFGIGMF